MHNCWIKTSVQNWWGILGAQASFKVAQNTPGLNTALGEMASYLVDKLLHSCLQAPHLELDHHQLVGAHDGLGVLPPTLLQWTPASLGGAEISEVLPPSGRGMPLLGRLTVQA